MVMEEREKELRWWRHSVFKADGVEFTQGTAHIFQGFPPPPPIDSSHSNIMESVKNQDSRTLMKLRNISKQFDRV